MPKTEPFMSYSMNFRHKNIINQVKRFASCESILNYFELYFELFYIVFWNYNIWIMLLILLLYFAQLRRYHFFCLHTPSFSLEFMMLYWVLPCSCCKLYFYCYTLIRTTNYTLIRTNNCTQILGAGNFYSIG